MRYLFLLSLLGTAVIDELLKQLFAHFGSTWFAITADA